MSTYWDVKSESDTDTTFAEYDEDGNETGRYNLWGPAVPPDRDAPMDLVPIAPLAPPPAPGFWKSVGVGAIGGVVVVGAIELARRLVG